MADRPKSLLDALQETWPAKLAKGIWSGATLPGDVYAGRADINTPEGFARVQDLAGLGMTGGIPAMAKTPGVTLTSGANWRPSKPVGGYIGSIAPVKQVDDIGTHVTTLPNVAMEESLGPTMGNLAESVRPKTSPVIADVSNALKFPRDPINWSDPASVVEFTRMGMEMGLPFPKNIFSGLESAAKQTGGLKENLAPMLKEKGFDSIHYPKNPGDPRIPTHKPNSLLVFDRDKVIPRFSGEGQELIKSRGILEPSKKLYMDDAHAAWKAAPERLRNLIDWINADPGAMQTLSKQEKAEVFRLLTKFKTGQ